MIRVLRILLIALLLGPQVGTAFVPADECQEERACCPPDGPCDVDCVACDCCPTRSLDLTISAALEPTAPEMEPRCSLVATVVLPLFPSDILHVPKSA